MNFKDKKVLVCGIALSGISAAILLNKMGAFVTLQDIKTEDKIDYNDLQLIKDNNINLYLGKNPDDILYDIDYIIVSPGIPLTLPYIQKAKKLNIPIIGELELGYIFCKSQVIGITGTNGKTTTTTLVSEIIKNFKGKVYTVGNIGIPFTSQVLSINEDDICVAEVSSFQLETIKTFRPNIACVLNITPDHLDRHKTYENYILSKENIFSNQKEDDYLILNYDDKICFDMARKSKSKVIFFSTKEELDRGIFYKKNNIFVKLDQEYVISTEKIKVLGLHNIENIIAAIAISECLKIPKNIIIETINNFKGVEHRIEYVTKINNIKFYNDSKGTNVEAAIKSIEAMERPILLIAGGYDKKVSFTEFAKVINKKVKQLVLIGESSDKIIEECNKLGYTNIIKVNTLEEAVKTCYIKAENGDCILLSPACASWDMFKSYEERGNLFKEIVLNLRGVDL